MTIEKLPFTSLTLSLIDDSWIEAEVSDDNKGENRIFIPEAVSSRLTPEVDPHVETSLKVRCINQTEIDSGSFLVPEDGINLGNLDLDHFDLKEENGSTLIGLVVDYFNKAEAVSSGLGREQLVFSRSQHELVILPRFQNSEHTNG